jgi:hypothetical protein
VQAINASAPTSNAMTLKDLSQDGFMINKTVFKGKE